MRRLACVLVVVAGCRGSCDGAREGGGDGPPMPRGMLVPVEAGVRPAASAVAAVDLAPHTERVAGVAFAPAAATDTERNDVEAGVPGTVYLSLEVVAIFHDALARAYAPGTFDLFVPRLVDGAALARELRLALQGLPAAGIDAHRRWPSVTEDGWAASRDALTRSGEALIQLAEARGRVWVFVT